MNRSLFACLIFSVIVLAACSQQSLPSAATTVKGSNGPDYFPQEKAPVESAPNVAPADSVNTTKEVKQEEPVSLGMQQKITLEADDDGFYLNGEELNSITVSKGSSVKILFNVLSSNVYNGGLDFRGCNQKAGAKPGSSVSFVFIPQSDCVITSYWPSTGVVKDSISVKVR